MAAPPLSRGERSAGARPGASGEDLACAYLEGRGFLILERNYRCRVGEVDLVARQGDTTVFVEVKERRGTSHGGALEAVTAAKRRRIVRAARQWATAHGVFESAARFDVVAVEWVGGIAHVRHEPGAFMEDAS